MYDQSREDILYMVLYGAAAIIIRKTKCSQVLKRKVSFHKTKCPLSFLTERCLNIN